MSEKNVKSGFSFDEAEFADTPEDQPETEMASQAEAVLDAVDGAAAVSDETDDLLDVDLRLETADYYRAILRHSFFEVEGQAAQIVDREIRGFIRERLEVLLGLREKAAAPAIVQAKLPFDDNEVDALKALAARVLKKPSVVEERPLVKKMGTPPPARQAVQVPKKPVVKRIPAPAPAPSSKPVVAAKKPAPAPPVAEKPRAKPGPKPKPKPNPEDAQTFVSAVTGKPVTLVEGEVIEENGKKFLVCRNEAGTLYRKDISGQVMPANRPPPMSPQQISIMSEMQAREQLNSIDDLTGMAIVASLTQGS